MSPVGVTQFLILKLDYFLLFASKNSWMLRVLVYHLSSYWRHFLLTEVTRIGSTKPKVYAFSILLKISKNILKQFQQFIFLPIYKEHVRVGHTGYQVFLIFFEQMFHKWYLICIFLRVMRWTFGMLLLTLFSFLSEFLVYNCLVF